MIKNLNLSLKSTLVLATFISVILLGFTVFSAIYTQNLITKNVNKQLTQRLHGIKQTIETYDSLLKVTANSLYSAFSTQFEDISLNTNEVILVNGVETPLISNNTVVLNNNFDYVDNYTRIKGSTATVFARVGDDFIRVTTSLKRLDGSRTLGTFLGKKSPAYKHIMNGKKYFGTASLFGNEYMAVYDPIIKNDKVIGILYVGYNYTESYKTLVKKLKATKVGETGNILVLSNKKKGLVVLNPKKEAGNLLNKKDANGLLYIKEVYKTKNGSIDYIDNNSTKDEKTIVFEDYDDRNWKIALVSTKKDFLKESKEFTLILSILSFISILLVVICIYFIISLLVIKPLKNLQNGLSDFFEFLNNHKEDSSLIKISARDEIGNMSLLINNNITQIKKNILIDNDLIKDTLSVANEVKSGSLTNRISKESNNPLLNDLKDVINSMLESIFINISKVQETLSSYATNDYTKTIDISNINSQIKDLYLNVNNLGQTTSLMLLNNLKTGFSLEENSNELSTITNTLSKSSNDQASSLEETAASIEELSATMTNNQNSMIQMTNNSKELQNQIEVGQKLANDTEVSMSKINEQTQAIAEAITIIDQISFQTNILSLNAAVEAATAGEAGKGFAVVAQEVRNLASRSAEAAKEIKELVENASSKTNDGKEIANNMISGYSTLNETVNKTTKMIQDVLHNFKEQVSGINQINNAVSQLDQLTQENANIAGKASDIASLTDKIAKEIVKETKEKEFIGK